MYFCQKIVVKILYNVKILANFTFSQKKVAKTRKILILDYFWHGNRIFGQKYVGNDPFQKKNRPFFDINIYFRHKSALESGRKLKICLGFSNHLSKSCKKSCL